MANGPSIHIFYVSCAHEANRCEISGGEMRSDYGAEGRPSFGNLLRARRSIIIAGCARDYEIGK